MLSSRGCSQVQEFRLSRSPYTLNKLSEPSGSALYLAWWYSFLHLLLMLSAYTLDLVPLIKNLPYWSLFKWRKNQILYPTSPCHLVGIHVIPKTVGSVAQVSDTFNIISPSWIREIVFPLEILVSVSPYLAEHVESMWLMACLRGIWPKMIRPLSRLHWTIELNSKFVNMDLWIRSLDPSGGHVVLNIRSDHSFRTEPVQL